MGGVISLFLVSCRSRRDKFYKAVKAGKYHVHQKKMRCREPSRIPRVKLSRAFRKSRKLRQAVRRAIVNNFPKSSHIHCFTHVFALKKNENKFSKYFVVRKKQKSRLFSRNCEQKIKIIPHSKTFIDGVSQRAKYFQLLLSGDIETNPGPVVNPTKTIAAPYSQSNAEVFGIRNAGRQCVAMSLSALIYLSKKSIDSSNDLVQIMDIGNDLYSTLYMC